jgi:hypothetical protein
MGDTPRIGMRRKPVMHPPIAEAESPNNHLLWVRARMLVDAEFLDFIGHGFALIVTAIGVIVILLALRHAARMTAWVNADAFGDRAAPPLPDERRLVYLAIAAVVIGVISFVALLLLPS